jgi:Flp pilus assembly protein TadG
MTAFKTPRAARWLDDRGNVAIVVALAMGPICVAGLGAADLARATSAKVQLQDALDAAALSAARTPSTTDSQLQAAGERFLRQNLKLSQDFRLKSSSFTFGDNGRVVASAEVDVNPFLAGLVTGGAMAIRAASEVVRADMKVEVALVLDNTGSMKGKKLSDLKLAASQFVDKMENLSEKAVEPNSVRISLVPFANTVRVDESAYRRADWIDQNGDSPINDEIFTTATGTQHANRFDLFDKIGVKWRGCVEMRRAPYDVQDTPPTTGVTLYTPYFAVDEPDQRTQGYGSSYKNDYLDDDSRSSNWRVRQGSITKYKRTQNVSGSGKGPNRDCGVQRIKRLTTDFDGLRDAIDDMEANGNTNIPIGMAWGWNTISPYAPFEDGVAYDTPKYKKIVVLMTDGDNTMDQLDTPNDGSYAATGYIWQGRVLKADGTPLQPGAYDKDRTAALDSRLKLLCQNMKAKDIEIYTVRVEVRSGDSSLLRNCATSRDNYYDVKDSSALTAVFQSIAGQIAALHLSR